MCPSSRSKEGSRQLLLEVAQATVDERGYQIVGVFPFPAALVVHDLVHSETTVDLEIVDRFRIGFVEGVVVHEVSNVIVLGHLCDPTDNDRFQFLVEEYRTVQSVCMYLVKQSAGASVTVIAYRSTDAIGIIDLHLQELIDQFYEDILRVIVMDVERGTIDLDAFTKFFDGYADEGFVLHHLQHLFLDGCLGVYGAFIRFPFLNLVNHIITLWPSIRSEVAERCRVIINESQHYRVPLLIVTEKVPIIDIFFHVYINIRRFLS